MTLSGCLAPITGVLNKRGRQGWVIIERSGKPALECLQVFPPESRLALRAENVGHMVKPRHQHALLHLPGRRRPAVVGGCPGVVDPAGAGMLGFAAGLAGVACPWADVGDENARVCHARDGQIRQRHILAVLHQARRSSVSMLRQGGQR